MSNLCIRFDYIYTRLLENGYDYCPIFYGSSRLILPFRVKLAIGGVGGDRVTINE